MSLLWLAETGSRLQHPGFRSPLVAALIALAVSWGLTPFVRKLAIRRGAVDDPNSDDRRVHKEPTPRWGGLAIFAGIWIAVGIVMPFAFPYSVFPIHMVGLLLCSTAIVIMGALDDLYQFKASIQALILIAVGVAVQFFVTRVSPSHSVVVQIQGFGNGQSWTSLGWAAYPLTTMYLFVITKTMDTIDGIDGLAAGIAAIAGATLCIVATYFVLNKPNIEQSAYLELPRVAIIAAAITGASLGFLRHNYNPAKIFMGTGGAQLLGFMLAALSIVGVLKTAAAVALVIPIFAFGIPMFDAAFVVFRRILSRQPITQGDKRHLHHTLLGKGLTQRQTFWVLCLTAMVLCGVVLAVMHKYV